MKPYAELEKIDVAATEAYTAWEGKMVTFTQAFVSTLRAELAWPADSFSRLDFDKDNLPPGSRWAPGGYVDATGYRFAVRMRLGRSWLQVVFAATLAAGGGYEVKVDDHVFKISLDQTESFTPLLAFIESGMTKTILEREVAAQTGYKPGG